MSLTGRLSTEDVHVYCLGDKFYAVVAKRELYNNILDQIGNHPQLSFPPESTIWILDGGESTGEFSTLEESKGLVELIKKIVWSMKS